VVRKHEDVVRNHVNETRHHVVVVLDYANETSCLVTLLGNLDFLEYHHTIHVRDGIRET